MRFNAKAHTYEAHAQVQRALATWGQAGLPESLEGKRVVELGAGTGLFTRELLARQADVTATDNAPSMLAEGARQCPQANWKAADAWNPTITTDTFDLIASSALLQWALDPANVLKKWIRIASSNGKLFCLIFAKPSLPEWLELCPEATPLAWRSATEWQRACAKAGWQDVRTHTETFHFTYPSTLALLRSLHRIGATAPNRLPATRLRALLKLYEARHALPEGGVGATWTFLRLEASAS